MKPLLLLWTLVLLLAPTRGLFAQKLEKVAAFKNTSEPRFNCIVVSPNGKLVALGLGDSRSGLLKVWEVATGKAILDLTLKNEIQRLAFSPDSRLLASADGRSQITIWDIAKGQERITLKGYLDWGTSLTFSSDGKSLGAAGRREVKVWDVGQGKEIASFQTNVSCDGGMAFRKDLKRLAAPNFQEIDLWDTTKGKELAILSEHRGQVSHVLFSPDGKVLVSLSNWFRRKPRAWEGQIKIWDLTSGKERVTHTGQFGHLLRTALSPNGKMLAFLHTEDFEGDAELRVLDLATNRVLFKHVGKVRSLHSLEYGSDGTLFVFEVRDEQIQLWKLPPLADK
jgi:WD40 repeat protein